MLNIIQQEEAEKQEYYENLAACFTNKSPEIEKVLEDELRFHLNELEKSGNADEKERNNAYVDLYKELLITIRYCYPLEKAALIKGIEESPDKIERVSKYYAGGKHRIKNNRIHLFREEIYELLLLCSSTNRKRIIHTIICTDGQKDDLLDSLSTGDKELFCKTLRNGCDYTALSHCIGDMLEYQIFLEVLELCKTVIVKALHKETARTEKRLLWYYSKSYKIRGFEDEAFFISELSDSVFKVFKIKEEVTDIRDIHDFTQFLKRLNIDGWSTLDVDFRESDPIEYSILRYVFESNEYKQYQQIGEGCREGLEEKDNSSNPDKQEDVTQNEERPTVQKSIPASIQAIPKVPEYVLYVDSKHSELHDAGTDKYEKDIEKIVSEEFSAKMPSAGGRPKEFWFKMTSYSYSEAQVKELMKRDIWPTLNLYLKQMKFPDNTKNIDSARKAFGAAIIVFSSSLVGLSDNSLDKYTPSMERTLGSSGSTVEKYLKMLKIWFPKLVQYYHGGKVNISIEKIMKRWMATDKPRALVLRDNFPEIRVTINNIAFLLEKTFHLGSQFNLMDWPEKRDRILDRALGYDERYQKGQSEEYSE